MSCLPTSRLWAPNLWVVNQRHLLFHSFTFLLLLKYLPLCMHKVQSVISWVSGVSRALALLSSPKGCQPGWSCSALSCVSRQPRVHMMTYWSWRRGQAGWRGQGEELEGTGLGWTSMYNCTMYCTRWLTMSEPQWCTRRLSLDAQLHNATRAFSSFLASYLSQKWNCPNVETDSQLGLLKGQLRQFWHNKRVDRGAVASGTTFGVVNEFFSIQVKVWSVFVDFKLVAGTFQVCGQR